MDDLDPVLPLKVHEWAAVSLLIVSLIVVTSLPKATTRLYKWFPSLL